MAKMRAKRKSCSPRHEEQIRKEARARTLNFDANNGVPRFCSNVSVFKQLINSGPYYMCCL